MVLTKILAIAAILALSPAGALAGPPNSVGSTSPDRSASPGPLDEDSGSHARPCKVTILMAASPGGYFRQIYGEDLMARGGKVTIKSFKCTVDETCKNPSCPDIPSTWKVMGYDMEKKWEDLGKQAEKSVWRVGKRHDL
ncbi:hypothetical protein PspLS_01594 [Pyricularia sp. CBS 133598]|nr:hypothetical protein PspLS_01594 [Pyricularia sp. CBS 133598]